MIEMIQKSTYKAFGLTILSEFSLPELSQVDIRNDVDVVIKTADLSTLWSEHSNPYETVVINEEWIMFRISDTGIFQIRDGRHIFVSPFEEAHEGNLRLYILGTCMGAILMQRKILPLHGSVIVIDGKANAIVGDSGAGKSTLASAFLQRGFGLLTDDVIAVSFSEEGIPFVTPSYPQQKLWSESLEQFDMESSNYQPLIDREDKFAIPVHSQFVDETLPLSGVFELVKGDYDQIEFEPINSLERIFKLYYHTYRNFFLQRAGLLEWHFQETTKLASKIDFYQLRRPTNTFTAHELTDLILNTIKREEKVYG